MLSFILHGGYTCTHPCALILILLSSSLLLSFSCVQAQEQRLEARDKKARDIANRYNVALSSHDTDTALSESDLHAIERELRDRAHLFQSQIETLRSEQRDEEEKVNAENQKWLSLQSASSEMKRLKRKTLVSFLAFLSHSRLFVS